MYTNHQRRSVARTIRLAHRRGYGSARTRTCASCGAVLPTALPVCAKCRRIERVDGSVTHHELLGLQYGPNPFVVDRGKLRQGFLQAQRLCHPDAWATGHEASKLLSDKDTAQAVSEAVNTAYKTLLSPLERIGYVLGREGKEVEEVDQAEDMELMEEVMETREAIEASTGAVLAELRAGNDEKIRAATEEIKHAVERADWTGAKAWAVRLKYLTVIEQAITQRSENAE